MNAYQTVTIEWQHVFLNAVTFAYWNGKEWKYVHSNTFGE